MLDVRATCVLLLTITIALFQFSNTIERVDHLFTYGENPARDREALAVLEDAVRSSPGDFNLLWRAARAAYYSGEHDKAISFAQRAIQIDSGKPDGHFWLAAGYGGVAEKRGMFKALTLIGKIRSGMETVVRIAPDYEHANAYLALCELDRQLPRIIGGSVPRAISYCEKGIRIAPSNLDLKLALARTYQEAGRKTDARRQLEELIAMPVGTARPTAERGVQEEARKMLVKF